MPPPVCIKFYIHPPSLLLSFSPMPSSLILQSHSQVIIQVGNYCAVPNKRVACADQGNKLPNEAGVYNCK